MSGKSIWAMTKQTFSEYSEDNVSRLSASLAYYTLFALAPLLVIAIAVAGFIWGKQAASGQVYAQLRSSVGDSSAHMVQSMVASASNTGSGIIATVIGVVLLFTGASAAFVELQSSLDTIWEVRPKSAGIWYMARQRLLSFAMVLIIGALLLASLVITAVASSVANRVGGVPTQWINNLAALVVFTVLFALVFKLLPDAKIRWRDVWVGAAITAILFTIGKYLIGLYLGWGGVSSVFGGAGSLVAVLVWVYYTAQIMFLGAEFTQVYARRNGGRIEPAENAERVVKVAAGEAERRPEAAAPAGGAGRPAVLLAREAKGDGATQGGRSRLVPLLLGAVAGRLLLSKPRPLLEDEARKTIRKRHVAHRHFAIGRAVEPGWVSRKEVGRQTVTRLRLPDPLYRAAQRLRHAVG